MKKIVLFVAVLFASSLLYAQATYEVGKVYEINGAKGLVYKVSANGRHGMMMSLQSCPSKESVAVGDKNLSDTLAGLCKDRENGMNNLKAVESYVKENNLSWDKFPIFAWTISLGDGWYIPSEKEMQEMISCLYGAEFVNNVINGNAKAIKDVQNVLKDNGGEKINFPMVCSTYSKYTNKKGKSTYFRKSLSTVSSNVGGIIGLVQDAQINRVTVSTSYFNSKISGARAIKSF
ncbi:MAG: hypothetical protein IKN78_07400 [Bacteroidales bacterium]|nr:hypothetical protein [Bacteroidales bacterium]